MKAVLLIEDDGEEGRARAILECLGFSVLRYRNVLKALDNLEELDPEAFIISAEDFPRHWKVLTEVVRATKGKNECVIVLLGGDRFDLTEADKASRLRINGVLGRLDSSRERSRLERLLKRYVEVHDPRKAERIAPAPWDRIAFAFSEPATLRPVFGTVETLSSSGLSFRPALPFTEFSEGSLLMACTLRVGDRLIDLDCRIIREGASLGLSIEAMSAGGREYLIEYLARAAEREVRARASS
jgi:hypothetical protein